MTSVKVFIPDPAIEEKIPSEQTDRYERWVKEILIPILESCGITCITPHHKSLPLHSSHSELIDCAVARCSKILYPLLPALARNTALTRYRAKTVFLKVPDTVIDNFSQYVEHDFVLVNCRNEEEIKNMACRLLDQGSSSSTSGLIQDPPPPPPPLPPRGDVPRHTPLHAAHSVPALPPHARPTQFSSRSASYPSLPVGRDDPCTSIVYDEEEETDTECTTSSFTIENESDISEYLHAREENKLSGDKLEEASSGRWNDDPTTAHGMGNSSPDTRGRVIHPNMIISEELKNGCQHTGSHGDMECLEDLVNDILHCNSKAKMDRLRQCCTQMVTRHLIPYASQHQCWVVLLKLFVFGSNIAVQLKAGQTLKADLLHALCRQNSHGILCMEEVLQQGLNMDFIHMNLFLASLFSEIYYLTIAAKVLSYKKEMFEKKQKLLLPVEDKALTDFTKKCLDHQKALSRQSQSKQQKGCQDLMLDQVHIHMQLAVDFLKEDLLSAAKGDVVGSIMQEIHSSSNESKTPEDKKQLKQNLKKMLSRKKPSETESCLLLLYMASYVKHNPNSLYICNAFFINQLKKTHTKMFGKVVKTRKRLLVSCAWFCLHMYQSITSYGDLDIAHQNSIQAVVDASKAFDSVSIYHVKQILSPLLHHDNRSISTQAQQAILLTEDNGKWSPESRENFCEFQRQYLEEKLCPFGIVLQPCGTMGSNNFVTYRGKLHSNQGAQRVTCRATAPCGPDASIKDADDTLVRTIDVMEALHGKDQLSSHFVHILLHDQTRAQKFYVSNQDWRLKNLSEVLRADLGDEPQKIRLEDKMKIIQTIINATCFAHEKGILLRSFAADSFTVQENVCGIHVTFSDMEAARRAHNTAPLKFTGNKDDALPVPSMAPESILNCQYNEKTEVYSLSLGCYEILYHGVRAHSKQSTAEVVRQRLLYMNLPDRLFGIPLHLFLIVISCQLINPDKRPTIQDLHDMLTKYMETDLKREEQTFSSKDLEFLMKLAERQTPMERKLPSEFKDDLTTKDIWARNAGSELHKRYTDFICNDHHASLCSQDEVTHDDDPQKVPETGRPTGSKPLDWFEMCIKKNGVDQDERNRIVHLKHPNLPSEFSFTKSKRGDPVLRVGMPPTSTNLLHYFLQHQPGLQTRIEFYMQIIDAVSHLHDNGLVLCYLIPQHIRVLDGSKTCVLSHLGKVTRLERKSGKTYSDVTLWLSGGRPHNTSRWLPLESNQFGLFSQASNVAMIGLCILQLESMIGKSENQVPYAYVSCSELLEAQRCRYNPPQAQATPDWLYQVLLTCIHNQPFRRPTTTHVKKWLNERAYPLPLKKEDSDVEVLRQRVSLLLDEEESNMKVDCLDVSLNNRGSLLYQTATRSMYRVHISSRQTSTDIHGSPVYQDATRSMFDGQGRHLSQDATRSMFDGQGRHLSQDGTRSKHDDHMYPQQPSDYRQRNYLSQDGTRPKHGDHMNPQQPSDYRQGNRPSQDGTRFKYDNHINQHQPPDYRHGSHPSQDGTRPKYSDHTNRQQPSDCRHRSRPSQDDALSKCSDPFHSQQPSDYRYGRHISHDDAQSKYDEHENKQQTSSYTHGSPPSQDCTWSLAAPQRQRRIDESGLDINDYACGSTSDIVYDELSYEPIPYSTTTQSSFHQEDSHSNYDNAQATPEPDYIGISDDENSSSTYM